MTARDKGFRFKPDNLLMVYIYIHTHTPSLLDPGYGAKCRNPDPAPLMEAPA